MLSLEEILFSQGFGSRRECRALVYAGRVRAAGALQEDPDAELEEAGLVFEVDGVKWPYFEKAIVAMNKPAGYECSMKPLHHPGVMTLLPPPLRVRGLQPVGRLDEDTTGLLILTDDGALNHRLIHPKRHVKKTYEAVLKHPGTQKMVDALLAGVMLNDEPRPVAAVSARLLSEKTLEIVLEQGKYHQVKRMVAAAGNRVEDLRRVQFGAFRLPETLELGKWVFVPSASEITGAR